MANGLLKPEPLNLISKKGNTEQAGIVYVWH
jgi:hypothetical protein